MMKHVEIIVPVKNEEANVVELTTRIDAVMNAAHIEYGVIFIDDNSSDNTFSIINTLAEKFPVSIFRKKGKPGKAYSILEGVRRSKADIFLMIDGDLQYPPEIIPQMIEAGKEHGIVIAKRKKYNDSRVRKVINKSCKYLLGKLLLNLDYDVQSGLKLFKRDIIERISEKDVYPWALDMPLLHTAIETGYTIGEVEIEFEKRKHGESKVNFLKTSWQIGVKALQLKLQPKKIHAIAPYRNELMKGAGVAHSKKRFITHTTLHPDNSAIQVINFGQKTAIYLILTFLAVLLTWNFLLGMQIIVAVLSTIYFADVLFNFFLIFKSLHHPPEITFSDSEFAKLEDKNLPVYTVLCPLYKEAHVLPVFLDSISKMDWPKNKLDVQLLLEEDDIETIHTATLLNLPSYVRIVIVPDSQPKTKPKACNYGLTQTKGEYLVIYDAEDIPDPLQLKKAFIAFQKVNKNVVCLQAKLNYHNPHQNLLTRLFTAEYSLWFDVILTGLQSVETTIPLGGTSNHFRTKDLLTLQGWDPFNVTEDCDLGIRLFGHGYKTAIIDSTTLEEANSNVANWIRQRSRWIKGYIQTYLVHMRNPIYLIKTQGWHILMFQLVVGGKIAFMFINPFLWVMTIAYFVFRSTVGPAIESLYPSNIFYMAAVSLVFGNFLFLYYYMIGVAKREQWTLMKYIFLVPLYWLLVSYAACKGLYQLITKPHYWEKTIHGLHLKKAAVSNHEAKPEIIAPTPVNQTVTLIQPVKEIQRKSFSLPSWPKFSPVFRVNSVVLGGMIMIAATMISHAFNFLFNTYLGRTLPIEEFGVIGLFSSLLFIALIPMGAFAQAITHKSAFLLGRYSKNQAITYFYSANGIGMNFALVVTLIYLLATPFLAGFFKVDSLVPFIIFVPVWLLAIINTNITGYLSGILSFSKAAFLLFISALTKAAIAYILIQSNLQEYILLAITGSLIIEFIFAWSFVTENKPSLLERNEKKFEWSFFFSAVLTGISTVSFLALDVILAKHFLSPQDAGKYALLSLVGKMTFFISSILLPFVLPIISKNLGEGKDGSKTFALLYASIFTLSAGAFVIFGLFGFMTVPILLGDKTLPILHLLPLYVLTIVIFSITLPIVTYFQAKKQHLYAVASFGISVLEVILVSVFHANLEQFVRVLFAVSVLNLQLVLCLYLFRSKIAIISTNLKDFFGLFASDLLKRTQPQQNQKRVLIFNWRDTKHVWSGGAEAYIHELAKRWVKEGYQITLFCGNDGYNPRNEVIDGIRIVRRGGFYTVYIWAFLYYIFKFRGDFDVVIDSENGIPFFTPLYVRIPKFLLIHHIHQEVFLEHLPFPLSYIGLFLETKLMPFVYKNQQIVTVSESSKNQILRIKLGTKETINVITPGVNLESFSIKDKSKEPSFVYLGRLKPYKNVDIAIKAFKHVLETYPNAIFNIAGTGESREDLQELVNKFEIKGNVRFLGQVSEKQKQKLLSQAWVMIQPSMVEGWGITVIEANSSGTPVIASDVNGLRDSVVNGKTGILVRPKHIEGFHEAMLKLISNKTLRHRYSAEAYKWSRNFSWHKSAENFLTSIDDEIDSSSRKELGKLALVEGSQ